jgi:TP901 family phage tail tape measure protein
MPGSSERELTLILSVKKGDVFTSLLDLQGRAQAIANAFKDAETQINASLDRLGKGFAQLGTQAAAVGAQANSIAASFTTSGKQATQAIGKIVSAVKKVEETTKQTVQSIKELGAAANANFTQAAAATTQLQQGAQQVNQQLPNITKNLNQARKEAEQLYFAALHMVFIGGVLSAATFFPIKAAAEFQDAMAAVVAVSEGARERLAELEMVANKLASTTRYMGKEVAEGMTILGMAGFDAQQILSAIGPTLLLAATEGLKMADAADIATSTLRAMQLDVSQLSKVVDILAMSATRSNASIISMGESLKYVAPSAAAAGIPLSQLTAMLGVLANNGLQGTLSGTALRGVLASLTDPAKEAQAALDRLGVSIEISSDGAIDLIKVLEDLGRANMTLAEANTIFERRSAAAALALSKQSEAVREMAAANEAAAGAAKEMADIRMDTLVGAFYQLKASADTFLRTTIQPMLGVFTTLTKAIAGVLKALTALQQAHPVVQVLATALVTLAAAAGGLTLILGVLVLAFAAVQRGQAIWRIEMQRLFPAAAQATAATVTYTSSVVANTAATQAATVATTLLGRAWQWLGTVIKAHPFFLISTALALALAAYFELTKSSERLRSELKLQEAQLGQIKISIGDLVEAYKTQIQESDGQKRAAKQLKDELLSVADSNDKLEASARLAAKSINEQTGEIIDGGQAIKEFRIEVEKLQFTTMLAGIKVLASDLSKAGEQATQAKAAIEKFNAVQAKGVVGQFVISAANKQMEEATIEAEKKRKELQIGITQAVQTLITVRKLDVTETEDYAKRVAATYNFAGESMTMFLTAFREAAAKTRPVVQGTFDAAEMSVKQVLIVSQAAIETHAAVVEKARMQYSAALKSFNDADAKSQTETRQEHDKALAAYTAAEDVFGKTLLAEKRKVDAALDKENKKALEIIKHDADVQRIGQDKANRLSAEQEQKFADQKVRAYADLMSQVGAAAQKAGVSMDEFWKRFQQSAAGKDMFSAIEKQYRTLGLREKSLTTEQEKQREAWRKEYVKLMDDNDRAHAEAINDEIERERAKTAAIIAGEKRRFDDGKINRETFHAFEAAQYEKLNQKIFEILEKRKKEEIATMMDLENTKRKLQIEAMKAAAGAEEDPVAKLRLQNAAEIAELERKYSFETFLEEEYQLAVRELRRKYSKDFFDLLAKMNDANQDIKEIMLDAEYRAASDFSNIKKVQQAKELLALETKHRKEADELEKKYKLLGGLTEEGEANLAKLREYHQIEKGRLLIKQRLDLEEAYWEKQRTNIEGYKAALEAAYAALLITETEYNAKRMQLSQNFWEGITIGLDEAMLKLQSWGELGLQIGRQVADQFATGVTGAIFEVIEGTKTLEQAFNDMFKNLLKWIAEAIIKMLIMKALQSMGGGGSMTPAEMMMLPNKGGLIPHLVGAMKKFASGGAIPLNMGTPGRDSIPALVTPGEYVVREAAVRKYGVAFMDAINRGLLQFIGAGRGSNIAMMAPRRGVSRRGYAAGGEIITDRTVQSSATQEQRKQELTIINLVDPSELDRYMATSRGKQAVLNVIRSSPRAVKLSLG